MLLQKKKKKKGGILILQGFLFAQPIEGTGVRSTDLKLRRLS
jgi:hypothetical protein